MEAWMDSLKSLKAKAKRDKQGLPSTLPNDNQWRFSTLGLLAVRLWWSTELKPAQQDKATKSLIALLSK
eukprot:4919437-Lingulodinium_polyedra.AAC.1